jgi:hypothetical protein
MSTPATNAQRQRKPRHIGDEGDAQRNEQNVQHEQFGGFALRHQMEPAAHQALTDE